LGGLLGSDPRVMKRRTSDVRLDGTLTEICLRHDIGSA
jgi:hypothetical protein